MNSSSDIKIFLEKSDIHKAWINNFRTKENEAYFEKVFDKIVKLCGITSGDKILDAGCGSANHSIRLAKKGYSIQAVDFSSSALELAKQKTVTAGLSEAIHFQQEDLTALSFDDNSFDVVYCWGVLMHIPNVDAAVKELARVVKPNGYLIISENNKHSVEVVMKNALDKIRRRNHYTIKTDAGLENWYAVKGDESKLFVRQLDSRWLTKILKQKGLNRLHRIGGQFTEAFIYFKHPFIRKGIHAFNNFWFRFVCLPYGAYSNIFIFKKQ